jgi:hypothetical protein
MRCLRKVMSWFNRTTLMIFVVFSLALAVFLGIGDEAMAKDSSKRADQDKKMSNQITSENPRAGRTLAAEQKESTRSSEGRKDEPKAEPDRATSATKVKAPPFKDFVPSEQIAADQAVDFPVDI